MKIDYAIHASDSNPLYLDFWEPVSKLWKLKFGVTPVLLYFGEGDPTTKYGDVIKIDCMPSIPLPLQCQWARYWYATTIKDNVGIISDIDMLPLSKHYFIDQIKNIDNTKYVHLNPCFGEYPRIPACYHVATGDTYEKVLGKYDTFAESMNDLISVMSGDCWYFDEAYSTHKIKSYNDQTIFQYLPREGGQNGHRIDRPKWFWDDALIKSDWYFDAHCARPYSLHREGIDRIVENALA